MTEPTRPRPVPGPPRPVPGPPRPGPGSAPVAATDSGGAVPPAEAASPALAGLDQRPVAEHVAVFEAEHDRLQRELATIDQL